MVNLGLNWSSLLGIILAVSGAGLYFLRSWRPKLARDHDIFFAAIGLLCGGILLFQGWRLDPILAFGQFLLTGSAIFFAVESIRLRGLATAQAKGRSSSPIVDEDRYVSDVYRVDDDQYDELEPREEDPQMRRLRGTQDSRSSRYEDDRYRPAKGRRSSMDRPSSSERPTRRPRPRPDSRSRSYSDDWEATIDPVDSTPERSSRSSSRRPTSRVESPLDTSENRWDDVNPMREDINPTTSTPKPRKTRRPTDDSRPKTHSRDRLDPSTSSTDYVDYRPVDYSDDDF